jgi:hypothetical protein
MGIFLKDIQQFIVATQIKEHVVVKEIVEEIIDNVVMNSPVDTGNFVTNWLMGLDNNMPWGVTGSKNPIKENTADKLIGQIPLDAANHNYNLVNNSAYSIDLENGKSGQAPMGIIGLTKVKIPSIISRVLARNA